MDNNEIRLWISRILSGIAIINHKKYQIPTLNEASETVYHQTFSEAIFLGCYTSSECENLVGRINIEPLTKKVNSLKVELYNLRNSFEAAQNVRSQLVAAKKDLTDALRHNSSFYVYSAEYVASYARDITFFGGDVISEISEVRPSEEQIREIARSGEWYSLWSASKLRLFPKIMTEDQVALVNWTTKYLNVLKHPKRPETWVIDDDDMLDGWMLSSHEEEKKPEPEGGGDIFYFAKTPGEAQKIFEKNDLNGQLVIKARNKKINEKGQISEAELPDIKREVNLERNRNGRV